MWDSPTRVQSGTEEFDMLAVHYETITFFHPVNRKFARCPPGYTSGLNIQEFSVYN